MMGKSNVLRITQIIVCVRMFNVVEQEQAAEAVMLRGGRQVSPSSLSAWRQDQKLWRPLLGWRYWWRLC